ncbi:MAG TPA: ribosome silencing factor [Candidatus Kapabacteria bacterium]|jgi:ribosome-associated protein|nr:ribosome silencing factor [Candidatus Kapabacteria bacterium]
MEKAAAKTTKTTKSTVKKTVRASKTIKKVTPQKRAPAKRPRVIKQPDQHELIRSSALKAAHYAIEKKAIDVHVLDLTKITSMTDFFVVATGDSDRQVKAIAENVIVQMRDTEGVIPWRSEGWDSLRWVLIDFVDFVVHVFQSEARLYYNIERLWADAPTVTVEDTAVKPKAAPKKKSVKSPAKAKSPIKVISGF